MNEKSKNNNVEKKDEIIRKKNLNSNNVNKKANNKDSIRMQKRLFQMQKRHALFNEEDSQELESENNIILNEESNKLNSLNNPKKLGHIHTTNRRYCKINLSFNYKNSIKDNLNIEQIQHKKSHVNQKSKNNLDNMIPEKIEQEFEQQNLKEEEISLKKKNTNSNTNDEDKASTEALFPNEIEINRKKSKSIFHNDSSEKDVFNKIIIGDMDENPNIFSGSNDNDNNEMEEDNMEKEEIDFQENLMNNFDFNNIINNETGSKHENIENDNSVIINETDQENNINENNEEEDNKEDSNVELNISNLDIDINEIKEEDNTQNEDDLTMSGSNSNEFAKKYLSSKSKSFIKFNNNLTARVAADNLKNSLSYMLALCPELMGGVDKKNLIKENYAATDVISEDIEAENFTPRQSEKIDESPDKKIKGGKTKNNKGINTKDNLNNKTFRNKEIKSPFEIKKLEKENNSPKTHYKNRSKIDRNIFNVNHYLDNEINNNKFAKAKNAIKNKSINFNIDNDSNTLYNNYYTNNDKYRNSTIINTEHIKIKYRHQKAKSLVNNNQIDSFNLNLNSNIKHKQHSPKQISEIFNKKNTINKILYKNVDNKKKKSNISKDKETGPFYNKQNYLSNDNNKKGNQKYYKKSNSNVYNNTMVKSHCYCKSDLRDKVIDIKKKFTFVRKNNAPDLSKSNNLIHKKSNEYNDEGNNNKICFTEKTNKSKSGTSFISHIKKNTPDNINNVSEQNINHSKKLSQQITDGYKFFMNSINTNNHPYNRYNNNDKMKNIKRKRIGSNNFKVKSTPLSNYFSFNKNKVNNYSGNNNNVTFIKKTTTIKEDKVSRIIPSHNKSKTSFITPSYQNLIQTKNRLFKKNFTLINNNKSKKATEISAKNIKKNYIKKINNKFNEIKKIVNDSSIKIVHKKINTIGQSNELTKILNNNSNIGINKQLKDSSSYSNYKKNFNKHKIVMALQHIKFSPMTNYSKVLNELYKSKKNLFVILVYTDSIKRYIFRGLYEVNSNDNKIANKIFAPGYGQNKLNISRLNNFFNYQSNNGDFIRIKFNNEGEKKFNSDTIIVY